MNKFISQFFPGSFRRVGTGVWGLPALVVALGLLATGGALAEDKTEIDANYLYEINCLSCHGDSGEGDGPAGIVLPVKPLNLQRSGYIKAEDPQPFIEYLKKNNPISSATKADHYSKNISDSELKKLIFYFMKMSKMPAGQVPLYPNQTYVKSCIFCHGYLGDGKGVINNFVAGQSPYNFRSSKSKRFRFPQWKAILKRSQSKTIRMTATNPHFYRNLTDAESKVLHGFLRKLTRQNQ